MDIPITNRLIKYLTDNNISYNLFNRYYNKFIPDINEKDEVLLFDYLQSLFIPEDYEQDNYISIYIKDNDINRYNYLKTLIDN